jgi:hypothetical protein
VLAGGEEGVKTTENKIHWPGRFGSQSKELARGPSEIVSSFGLVGVSLLCMRK